MRMRIAALSMIVTACTTGGMQPANAPAERSDEPYACHGRPAPVEEPMASTTVLPGRFEIKRLSAALAPCTPEEDCDTDSTLAMRVRIMADAIPLGTLATGLSNELGLAVVVDAPFVGLQVSFAMPETTLRRLIDTLRRAYRVYGAVGGRSLRLMSRRDWEARKQADFELTPIETRIVPVPEPLIAKQIAATYCEELAGPDGVASVLGHALVVRDRPNALALLEGLVSAAKSLDKPAVVPSASASAKVTGAR